MKGVYCGCHESYPQMRDRFVSHAPGCPLRVALEERDALRARAEAAEAKADRLAKLLGEARTIADKVTQLDHEYTASHAKVYGISDLPDPDYPAIYLQEAAALICARIDAALSAVSGLAEKEVGDGNG